MQISSILTGTTRLHARQEAAGKNLAPEAVDVAAGRGHASGRAARHCRQDTQLSGIRCASEVCP